MLDLTWKEATTRDRGFRKPPKLKVVMVQQNCNHDLWKKYHKACKDILCSMGDHPRMSCKTRDAMVEDAVPLIDMFGPLDTDANEFLLFHGSKPSAVEEICKNNFNVQLAGSNAGTLYGPGLYLAENSSKSDEYAADDDSGIYKGLYAMLLCRVACGRILYTDALSPDKDSLTKQCTLKKRYDTVLGDREKTKGTYREFVVFNSSQVYPECVILYRRESED
jgi:hypothetical protein